MAYIIDFGDEQGTDHAQVGGKAASLGRLVALGFPVPPGFTVATDAYSAFVAQSGLGERIQEIVAAVDFDDAAGLERETARVRDLIISTEMPSDLSDAIVGAYRELGAEFVAVRSSGTAEDLAGASFAGLHDTYLDITGADAVLDAVRRCWASMWTARATAYRHGGGFAQQEALLAVVVQAMVTPEVSGVMFTANPVRNRTDEIVINASWGLGEGVVSGVLNPDEFIVSTKTLAVKNVEIGDKQVEVVRDPDTGVGTVTRPTTPERQQARTLDDARVKDLARLGLDVMAKYGGLPQDTEWAYAEGRFYLLQARPVTGVDFTWDEEVDSWHPEPEDEDTVWTYTWSEQYWTGGISPLFYSCRAYECYLNYSRAAKLFGFKDLENVRWHKYHRATAYFNADAERSWLEQQWPPQFRDLTNIPPIWQDDFKAKPADWGKILKLWARVHTLSPELGVTRWWGSTYDYLDNRTAEADGLSAEELRDLSDDRLLREAEKAVAFVDEWYITMWPGFFWLASGAFGGLATMLEKWYTGDNPAAFQDLISGIPHTKMAEETEELFDLSEIIRGSERLTQLMAANEGEAFFAALEDDEEGRAFLEQYGTFIHNHGHRGHQDRDFYYFRRVEKPSLDYDAFKQLLSIDNPVSPRETMATMVAKREAATEEVLENLRRKPLGGLRVELFKYVLDYAQRFLKYREDERHYLDRLTFRKKKIFLEIGSRMWDRGLLTEPDDFWFLCRPELYAYYEGRAQPELARAKMTARKRVFHNRNLREEYTPTWLQNGLEIDLSGEEQVDDGSLSGFGTSRGLAKGPSRIVPQLDEIGRVEQGDILVCNSTDPGWMSVFPKIKGLVLETGGMLAHGACLSREYGIPAVQIRGAMQRVPDGVQIEVNGDTGKVRELDGNDDPVEPREAVSAGD
jgi:pyruvate,water dikinase